MATEMTTTVKRVVPYLVRRGYNIDENLFFGERTHEDQVKRGFVDILVKESKKGKALFAIEIKRDEATINNKHRKQALGYGEDLKLPFVVATNGKQFEILNVTTGAKLTFNGSPFGKVPRFADLKRVLAQFKKDPELEDIVLTKDHSLPYRPGLSLVELNALFKKLHNTIRNLEKDEENIFGDFSKILFLKLLEEKDDVGELQTPLPYTYRFHELAGRPASQADQVKDAILKMLAEIRKQSSYSGLVIGQPYMKKPATYARLVKELAKASLRDSTADVKGTAFEYFVRVSLKGKNLGQFFTPRPLVALMASLVGLNQIASRLPDTGDSIAIVDPACGSGGFLLYVLKYMTDEIDANPNYDEAHRKRLKKRVKKDVFWGVEVKPEIAAAAKMNMIIAGDGFANIFCGDSLKVSEVQLLSLVDDDGDPRPPFADLILTNPPFGMSEAENLSEEDLAPFEVPVAKSQALFLQKMVALTKPGGRICTVIDEGMLNTAAMRGVREYVLRNCHIDAVMSLSEAAFKPNKITIKANILLMTKKESEDDVQPEKIRMVTVHQLGYGPSGEETKPDSEEIIAMVRRKWSTCGQRAVASESTAGILSSYALPLKDVFKDQQLRLDVKYYNPEALAFVGMIRKTGGVPIAELTVFPPRRGKSPSKASYNADGSTVTVVKAGNIEPEGDIAGTFDMIRKDLYDEESFERARLKRGDVLLASTGVGTLGKAGVYDRTELAIAGVHVTILRLDTSRVDPFYIAQYLRSALGQTQINRVYTGSTGLIELTEADVLKLLIRFLDDIKVQRQLARRVKSEFGRATKLEKQAHGKRESSLKEFLDSVIGRS